MQQQNAPTVLVLSATHKVALGQVAMAMRISSPKGSNNLVRRTADNAQGKLAATGLNALKAHDRRGPAQSVNVLGRL